MKLSTPQYKALPRPWHAECERLRKPNRKYADAWLMAADGTGIMACRPEVAEATACACRLDELSPVQCMSESCRPGVLLADATCDNCTKEAPCGFHIGDPPKVCGQLREETA